MGYIEINAYGSFPQWRRKFTAMEHGHAHAVAQAIKWLSEEVLPEAIEHDHALHDLGKRPSGGFNRG